MTRLPEEWLECKFRFKDGDYLTIDYELVEVDYADANGGFRGDKVKRWTISDGDLSREVTEDEIESVMVFVKDEYRDTAKELEPGTVEPETTSEEE